MEHRRKLFSRFLRHPGFWTTACLTLLATLAAQFGVFAAAPNNIVSYQGRLLDANGVPVTDASATMIFRFYDDVAAGNCLWSNSSTTCASATGRTVTLTDGLFSENLGDTNAGTPYSAIADTVFADNAAVYLSISVNGETLTPRKLLTAAPYALNAQALDGISSSGFLQTTGSHTATGTYDLSGATIAGGLSPFVFEGSSVDGNDLTLALENPTASRTITFPNASGTVVLFNNNALDFVDFDNNMQLDASTEVDLLTYDYTINADSTGDFAVNLSSTGDFVIQDNGTPFFTFTDGGKTIQTIASAAAGTTFDLSFLSNGLPNDATSAVQTTTLLAHPSDGTDTLLVGNLINLSGSASIADRYGVYVNGSDERNGGIIDGDPIVSTGSYIGYQALLESAPDVADTGRLYGSQVLLSNTGFHYTDEIRGLSVGITDLVSTGSQVFGVRVDNEDVSIEGDAGLSLSGLWQYGIDLASLTASSAAINTGTNAVDLQAASGQDLDIVGNGTGNIVLNLPSTGDLVVEDNGTPFVTFGDNSTTTFMLPATAQIEINASSTPHTSNSPLEINFASNGSGLDIAQTIGVSSAGMALAGDQLGGTLVSLSAHASDVADTNLAGHLVLYNSAGDTDAGVVGFEFAAVDSLGLSTTYQGTGNVVGGRFTVEAEPSSNGVGSLYGLQTYVGNPDPLVTYSGSLTGAYVSLTSLSSSSNTKGLTVENSDTARAGDYGAEIKGDWDYGLVVGDSGAAITNGLYFWGATTDITANPGEDIVIQPGSGGAGNLVLNLPNTGDLQIKDNGSTFFTFTDGGVTTQSLTTADSLSAHTTTLTSSGLGNGETLFGLQVDFDAHSSDNSGAQTGGTLVRFTDGASDVSQNGLTVIGTDDAFSGASLTQDGVYRGSLIYLEGAPGSNSQGRIIGSEIMLENTGANYVDELLGINVDIQDLVSNSSLVYGFRVANNDVTVEGDAGLSVQGKWAYGIDFGISTDFSPGAAIRFGASTIDLIATDTNDLDIYSAGTSGDVNINLTSATGDFNVKDNGTAFFTLSDAGGFALTLDGTDNPPMTVDNNGSSNIQFNLAGTGDFTINDNASNFLTINDSGTFTYVLDATDDPGFNITDLGNAGMTIQGNMTTEARSSGLVSVLMNNDGTNNFTGTTTSSLFNVRQSDTASSGTAAYVLQEGSGYAFQVDDISGDTSPFLIDSSGNVLIGGTAESLSNASFTLGGEDLYVAGLLGVEGNTFFDGVMTLAGSADGTDALVLTLGDILVTNGDLDLSGGDFNVTLDSADEVDITKSAGAAATEEGIDLTFTAGAGDGSDIYSALRITGTSANHSASTDKFYGINIAAISSADAQGDEVAVNVGQGWDTAFRLQAASSFTQTTSLAGLLLDYNTSFTPAVGTNIIAAEVNFPATFDFTSAGTQVYTGLDMTTVGTYSRSNGAGTQTLTFKGIDITTPDLAWSSGSNSASATGINITLGQSDPPGTGDAQVGLKINGTAGSVSGGVITGVSIENITTSNATEKGIAVGTGWDFAADFEGEIQFDIDQSNDQTIGVCKDLADGNSDVEFRECNGTPGDIAEWYPTDAVIGPGYLVATTGVTLDFTSDQVDPATGMVIGYGTASHTVSVLTKTPNPYASGMLGIISSSPVQTFGKSVRDFAVNSAPVALIGRVPAYVNVEGGAIAAGDMITASSTPGVGMKATQAGPTVGYALNAWTGPGQGMIEVFVSPGWYGGSAIEDDGTVFANSYSFASLGTATAVETGKNSHMLSFRGSGWNGSSAEEVGMGIKLAATDATAYRLSFTNKTDTEVAYVTGTGDLVLSGKLYPSDRGVAQTDKYIYYDGSAGPGGDFMRTNASGWSTGSYDFAEMFPSTQGLAPGELVVASPTGGTAHVERSSLSYQKTLLGIVSTKPGFLAGDNKEGHFPIALKGRVPTLVNNENGPIAVGDPLTSSSTPGYAMKAVKAGPVVGYALEPFGGERGSLIAFVSLGWWEPDAVVAPVTETTSGIANTASQAPVIGSSASSLTLEGNLFMTGNSILSVGRIAGIADRWSIEEDGTVKTEGTYKAVITSLQNEKVDTYATLNREQKVTLSGTGRLTSGMATIQFEAIDPKFNDITSTTAPVRILVTLRGPANGVYVATADHNGFDVRELANGTSTVDFDWYAEAYRLGQEPSTMTGTPVEPPPTEPVPVEPVVTEPVVTEPVPTEPMVTDSSQEVSSPQIPSLTQGGGVTEPIPTEPVVVEPVVTEPVVTEPPTTEPAPVEPVVWEPAPAEPVPTP